MKEAQVGPDKPLFWEARQVPFFRFLVCYVAGILSARWLEPSVAFDSVLWCILSISLIAFFALVFLHKRVHRYAGLTSLFFYTFLYVLGWVLLWQPHPALNDTHYSHMDGDYLIGYVDDEPRPTATGLRFPLLVSHSLGKEGLKPTSGRLMVSLRTTRLSDSTLGYGDQLVIPARQRVVSPPYNPNEFDYRSYLRNQGIWHSVFLPDSIVRSTGSKKGSWFKHKALGLRSDWVKKLRHSLSGEENFAIASALVLGYRGVLDPDTLQRFSKTGTIHVLSVSGLHVGIVFAVFSFLLRWMKGKRLDILKALLLIAAVWMYALLTGFSPSVLRAATMISFGIIALSLYRRANIFNTTCASAMFLLLYNPAFLFDVGFVLSYLAVLGIVSLHPIISSTFRHPSRWLSHLISYASISLAAQWMTFPFVFYYFHFFPVYFLPANMLIILPATLVVYLSALVLVLPTGSLNSLVSQLLEFVMGLMNGSLQFFEDLPYTTLEGIWISPFENLLLYALIFLLYLLLITRKRELVYLIGFICFVGVLSRCVQQFGRLNRTEVVLYNVNRDFAMSFFHNGTAAVFSSLSADNRSFQYSVLPNVQANTEFPPTFIPENASFRGSNLLVHSGLVQFGGRRLFLYAAERNFTGRIDVDILYIRNNSLKDLPSSAKSIRFKKIILDGSNHDGYIEGIKKEAEILDKPVYILKNNYAYVW